MVKNRKHVIGCSPTLLILFSGLLLSADVQAKGASGGGSSGGGGGGGRSGGGGFSGGSSRSSSSSSTSSSTSSASSASSTSASRAAPAVGSAGTATKPASNSYVPRSYSGPTRTAANGAIAPVTPLTGYRPTGAAAYRLPAYSSSAYSYSRNRPFLHSYPFGYSLLFIPLYSAAYTGNHWAVYNEQGQFWGYDDGDITGGDYDYDSGDGLPSGCQLSSPQEASSAGVLDLAAPAPAPTLALAPGNGTAFAPAPAPATSGNRTRQLLCKPLAAAVQQQQPYWTRGKIAAIVICSIFALVLLLVILFCCVPACSRYRRRRQSETQMTAQKPQEQQGYNYGTGINDSKCKV